MVLIFNPWLERHLGAAALRFIFADHTLDIDLRELRRGAIPVPVEPQVFDLLIYLLEHRDRVITKVGVDGLNPFARSKSTRYINELSRGIRDLYLCTPWFDRPSIGP